ncbi:MAG: hypothetical protein GY841_01915 [FCB group bacterium]|nr:hypothetical protein [FCB group bacterium]
MLLKDMQAHLEYIALKREVLSMANRKALETISRLAEKHQFEVFIANGPVYIGLYEDSSFQKYYGALKTELERITGNNPHLHYILNPPMTFDKEDLQSVDHVTATATQTYSTRLAAEMRSLSPTE